MAVTISSAYSLASAGSNTTSLTRSFTVAAETTKLVAIVATAQSTATLQSYSCAWNGTGMSRRVSQHYDYWQSDIFTLDNPSSGSANVVLTSPHNFNGYLGVIGLSGTKPGIYASTNNTALNRYIYGTLTIPSPGGMGIACGDSERAGGTIVTSGYGTTLSQGDTGSGGHWASYKTATGSQTFSGMVSWSSTKKHSMVAISIEALQSGNQAIIIMSKIWQGWREKGAARERFPLEEPGGPLTNPAGFSRKRSGLLVPA